MGRMNIVFPDRIDIPDAAKQKFKGAGVVLYDDLPSSEAEVVKRIADAEIITANYIDMPKSVIDAAEKLKYILVPAVGYEWVDYKYAASKGVKVLNSPTHNSMAVAEHAIGLLFALKRQLVDASISLREGNWDHRSFRGTEIHGRTIGLVGYGRIGKLVGSMAHGLGMTVRYVNSRSSSDDIDNLLRGSDVVCLCLPANGSTKHLLNRERLALLRPDAVVINVGRGATIDQIAMVEALRNRAFAGAALDVFDGEPLSGKPAQAIVDLANMPNVIATPHMGYNTEETSIRLGEELWENLESCLSGTPINLVN